METKRIELKDALQKLLQGETLKAREMQIGAPAFLRKMSIVHHFSLCTSGTFENRVYYIIKK